MTVVNDCQLLVSQLTDQLIEAKKNNAGLAQTVALHHETISQLYKRIQELEMDLWQL